LAVYCGLWISWIFAKIVEVFVPSFAGDFFVNILSDLVVGIAGFTLAIWQGEKILEYFAERRRIAAWRDVAATCSGRVWHALLQNLVGTAVRSPILKLSPPHEISVADKAAAHFDQWADELRTVLTKLDTLDGSVTLPSVLTDHELRLAAAPIQWRFSFAPKVFELTPETARRIDRVLSSFHFALPEDFRRALVQASVELERFNEQVELPDGPPLYEYQHVKNNLHHGVRMFRALADLSRCQFYWHEKHFEGEAEPIKTFGRRVHKAA
jgi:hypothetical protein